MNRDALDERDRWRAFHAWEQSRLHDRPADASVLQWMADAWELAERHDPDWHSRPRAEAHWRELREHAARLAVILPRA
jgi:hypothetical protein